MHHKALADDFLGKRAVPYQKFNSYRTRQVFFMIKILILAFNAFKRFNDNILSFKNFVIDFKII